MKQRGVEEPPVEIDLNDHRRSRIGIRVRMLLPAYCRRRRHVAREAACRA